MSAKARDNNNRWRSLTIAFRVSPEENKLLNGLVAASGLTKQDYIMKKLSDHEVRATPNIRLYGKLRNLMKAIYGELRRINTGESIEDPELKELLAVLADEFKDLRGEEVPENITPEAELIFSMDRIS